MPDHVTPNTASFWVNTALNPDDLVTLSAAAPPTTAKKRKISASARGAKTPKIPRTINGMPVCIVKYKSGSRSAKALAKLLNIGPIEVAGRPTVVLNWGSAHNDYFYDIPSIPQSVILNSPDKVAVARLKSKFFKAARDAKDGPRIPVFTESFDEALEWVNKGILVFGRKNSGSSGLDIKLYEDNPGEFQNSEFWVQYKKKKAEFRIHVGRAPTGEYYVIDKQQKVVRKTDPVTGEPIVKDNINFLIRNHRNGFIFQRNEITIPQDVITQAVKAVTILGLDFGAVDVIWNESESKAYVLEVNTAPGIEGTTLTSYSSFFLSRFQGIERRTATTPTATPPVTPNAL